MYFKKIQNLKPLVVGKRSSMKRQGWLLISPWEIYDKSMVIFHPLGKHFLDPKSYILHHFTINYPLTNAWEMWLRLRPIWNPQAFHSSESDSSRKVRNPSERQLSVISVHDVSLLVPMVREGLVLFYSTFPKFLHQQSSKNPCSCSLQPHWFTDPKLKKSNMLNKTISE